MEVLNTIFFLTLLKKIKKAQEAKIILTYIRLHTLKSFKTIFALMKNDQKSNGASGVLCFFRYKGIPDKLYVNPNCHI